MAPKMTAYEKFIQSKSQRTDFAGFDPLFMPDFLFDFQANLTEWAVRKGKVAEFADAGLGKTPMQLVWAENIVRKTNGRVLICTPLAVSAQTVREAAKFGIEAKQCRDGKLPKEKIVVTNYERLSHFKVSDFEGMVCDESGILKNFDGKTKAEITEFMRTLNYRLLATATPSPNDYIELGTSSEALGEMGYMDMLKTFFKADGDTYAHGGGSSASKRFSKNPFGGKFRFRGHSERDFWRWVCSWARAIRKPSDLGFDDTRFVLPELKLVEHILPSKSLLDGWLFPVIATNLYEQRQERRNTLEERCELAAKLATAQDCSIVWCHLNPEGDLLEKLIPGAVQVAGDDSDDFKEETFEAFSRGQIKKLVTKTQIASWGMNWQHCAHQTYFPSHSFEQWYQGVRRSWRFGQKNPVTIDMVTTEGEAGVLRNLQRKAEAADRMFSRLVELMHEELSIKQQNLFTKQQTLPSWI